MKNSGSLMWCRDRKTFLNLWPSHIRFYMNQIFADLTCITPAADICFFCSRNVVTADLNYPSAFLDFKPWTINPVRTAFSRAGMNYKPLTRVQNIQKLPPGMFMPDCWHGHLIHVENSGFVPGPINSRWASVHWGLGMINQIVERADGRFIIICCGENEVWKVMPQLCWCNGYAIPMALFF